MCPHPDRGFDANDYYRYFLKHGERFVIRAKKNRNVIYNGKTCNIMDVAGRYKGNYCLDFKDKSGRTVHCKMSCIPVRLCEFPDRELVLTVVYGFGADPTLLPSSLKMQGKKKPCHIIAKVYLLWWHIEEYFRFKKQQFELEDLGVMSLQSTGTGTIHVPLRYQRLPAAKSRSQQLRLFEYFKIADCGT